MSARSRGATAAKSGWAATAASRAALPSAGDGNRTEGDAGGGIGDLERSALGCVDPLAVDEQPLLDSLHDPCFVLLAHAYPFVVGESRYTDPIR